MTKRGEEMEGREKLTILLQQLGLTDDVTMRLFEKAYIQKVYVHEHNPYWEFHIAVQAPLPIEMYVTFVQKMRQSFQSIAQTAVTFQSTVDRVTEEQILSYWPMIFQQIEGDIAPPIAMTLRQQRPKVNGHQLILPVESEMEEKMLEQKYSSFIQDAYTRCAFPTIHIQTERFEGNAAEKEAERLAFLRQQQMEEEAYAKEVAQNRMKQLAEREESGTDGPFILGLPIRGEGTTTLLDDIEGEDSNVIIQGYVFDVEVRRLRSKRSIFIMKITDYTNSLVVKKFSNSTEEESIMEHAKPGMWVRARGTVQMDTYMNELVMMARDINEITPPPTFVREDQVAEEEKRVELHMHTKMTQMDSVSAASDIIERAAKWGHPAVAITDDSNVQAFPEAYNAGRANNIKVLFGMEANIVDDGVPIVYEEAPRPLQTDTYVVFDVETTGLSAAYDTIIELAAVKVKDGEIIDTFESFANPHHPLSETTTRLTGITDEMVQNAPEVSDMIAKYVAFIGDAVMVAHNASFDMGFFYEACRRAKIEVTPYPVIDTLELARVLYPELRSHRLNTLAKKFNIELTQHHRAIYDTEATAALFLKFLDDLLERGVTTLDAVNKEIDDTSSYKRSRPFKCNLLVQNDTGLKNLFKLVSYAHIDYFYRVPRIPRSVLIEHREGLLVGSGNENGEVFEAFMQKSEEEAADVASFYDYIEVHPKAVYTPLIERELIQDEWNLEDIIRKMVKVSRKLNIPLCATSNGRYVDPTDKAYREVLIRSQGGANPLNRVQLPETHFLTTEEMLEAFDFLGEEEAKEIVVTNTRKIADMIDDVKVIKDDLYTPEIEGAEEEVKQLTYSKAHEIYGDTLPEIVTKRIEKELTSIIDNGFAVIYLISHKLVKQSLEDGYLVGSRGSVGSSLVATLMDITEVNPLPPHYVCPTCHESEFFTDGSVASGYDLPRKKCSTCDVPLMKDGQDIPFETFLGFKGDKVPDIDLNFSGDYQPRAHEYTRELFGEDYVFRAGTIGTVAEKTAYGYVRGYMEETGRDLRGAEIDRLVRGSSGVKRSTGQHPGGIIVVPNTMDIYDFTPIQYPANDLEAAWKTTHFDFHSIEDNLLKLDILGHDDPTMIRMLQNLSGIDPLTIPTDDPAVMSLFTTPEALGVDEEQIACKTGTLGVPEFGTRFVRQMLEETKPSTFSELVQISGLSHGTDVWLGNAQELIKNQTCVLSEVIGCRDDIMVELIYKGLEPSTAFQIMEFVRKGKGLKQEWEDEMRKHDVPQWYIDSCNKIKYMFPKAHAAAYVLMALRIAYFKVHYPIMYYAAYFTVRASDHDLLTFIQGSTAIRSKIKEIDTLGHDASPKEKNLVTVLEIALEMTERGYRFEKPDLYRSEASEFIIDGDALIPPFDAIPSLGTNVAKQIVEARKDGEFLSKEDLQQRGRVSKTVIGHMEELGCLEGMPESNQLSLFDF